MWCDDNVDDDGHHHHHHHYHHHRTNTKINLAIIRQVIRSFVYALFVFSLAGAFFLLFIVSLRFFLVFVFIFIFILLVWKYFFLRHRYCFSSVQQRDNINWNCVYLLWSSIAYMYIFDYIYNNLHACVLCWRARFVFTHKLTIRARAHWHYHKIVWRKKSPTYTQRRKFELPACGSLPWIFPQKDSSSLTS